MNFSAKTTKTNFPPKPKKLNFKLWRENRSFIFGGKN
ncbi:unnamed protein product [Brassica oleracea var. botrytis]